MEIWGEVKKNYSYPPPNILEGNGVVFGNFTFNNLQLQVFTFYLYILLFKFFFRMMASC